MGNAEFEIIYNCCTVCKKETKKITEIILCEECKKLIQVKIKTGKRRNYKKNGT